MAQIQPAQAAPNYPGTSTPAAPFPAASQQVFGAPAPNLFVPQQQQTTVNQQAQHALQLQQMADVYVYERQRARAGIEQYVQSGLVADSFRNVAQHTSVVAPLPTLPPFPLLPSSQVCQSYDVVNMANTLTAYQMALQHRSFRRPSACSCSATSTPSPTQHPGALIRRAAANCRRSTASTRASNRFGLCAGGAFQSTPVPEDTAAAARRRFGTTINFVIVVASIIISWSWGD